MLSSLSLSLSLLALLSLGCGRANSGAPYRILEEMADDIDPGGQRVCSLCAPCFLSSAMTG